MSKVDQVFIYTIGGRQGDVAVPRSTIWDKKLSNGAFRLLCLALEVTSRRPDWKPYSRGFAKMLGVSERSQRYYEAELRRAGYLTVTKVQDEHGRFTGEVTKTYLCATGAELSVRLRNVPP